MPFALYSVVAMNSPEDGTAAVVVLLNGKESKFPPETSLVALLEFLHLERRGTAVERNGEVVPGDRLGEVLLEGGDRIEIVTLVGGG